MINQLVPVNEARLKIVGDLTFYTIKNLHKEATKYLLKHPVSEIDLIGVKNCDSAALLLLISLWRQSKAQNHSIEYLNYPKQLIRLMDLSNLHNLLKK
jgi:anti-anti-sigma factor